MNAHTYLTFAYLAFALPILAGLHWFLRSRAPIDRRVIVPVTIGTAGFVFHAFLFFSGTLLVVHLGFVAGVVGEILFWTTPAKKT